MGHARRLPGRCPHMATMHGPRFQSTAASWRRTQDPAQAWMRPFSTCAPEACRSHAGRGRMGNAAPSDRARTWRASGSRPYGLPGPRAWKPAMWPRQKGHSGAARPRAHSWYAHARQSACPQAPTAT